jgi:hypothetical protein
MPSLTISAVDTTANTLTVTAHGLLTGDRFRLRNINGALPASTPTLLGVTDYFAIVVDANTVKVSDTNAHALAGTGIADLTGSGTGTSFIEFSIPYCTPTQLAAPLTQIKSANDTNVWAALVALYDLLTGQADSIWSGVVKLAGSLTINGTLNGPIAAATITPALTAGNNNDFAPTGFANAIVLLVGAVGTASLTGMTAGVHGRMVYVINTGGPTLTITHQDSNSSASNRFLSPTAANIVLTSNQGTLWMYDTTASLNRWRLLSKNF